MNEPLLKTRLKGILLYEEITALDRALESGEAWIQEFVDEVGLYAIRDIIENLALTFDITEQKLSIEQKKVRKYEKLIEELRVAVLDEKKTEDEILDSVVAEEFPIEGEDIAD